MSAEDQQVGIHFVSHPSEDQWEEYVFGRLEEGETERMEEHLLACVACQTTLERVDNLIRLMRAAAPSIPPQAPGHSGVVSSSQDWIPFPPRPAVVALALAVVLAVGLGFIGLRRQESNLPVALVTLASFRGEDTASAPSGRPLSLEVSQADLATPTDCRLEIVTLSGQSAWKGRAQSTAGKLVATLPRGLAKGGYWVRLYDSGNGLIREFGLRVE